MSFILDALKKSEEERLRQQNPSTLPTTARRSTRKTPSWVWALMALLGINLVVLAVVLLKPAAESNLAAATTLPIVTATPSAKTPSVTPAVPMTTREPDTTRTPASTSASSTSAALADTTAAPPRTSLSSVPTRDQQIAAGVSLPPTVLNLHVYDADPSRRFVLLNGARLREGDVSRDGVELLSITPEGVVLSYGNSSFAVSIEGR